MEPWNFKWNLIKRTTIHVSLQLTSHTGPDITKIRWTRGETTRRGIALPQSICEKITSLNVAGARSEGRVEGPDREGFRVTKLYTTRLHFNLFAARA